MFVLRKTCLSKMLPLPLAANKDWNPLDTSSHRTHTDRENTPLSLAGKTVSYLKLS